jgi:retron-type reverse transcriptase
MDFKADMLYRPHFGSNWDNGAKCGSRSSNWNNPALNLNSNNGSQGVTDTGATPQGAYPTAEHIGLARVPNIQQGLCRVSSQGESPVEHLMKRHGNLWSKIITTENIALAYKKARKGKGWQHKVQNFEKNLEDNLENIRQSLIEKSFTTSEYRVKEVYEPKQRTIYILPFAPDRIVQHAVMNVLEPIWNSMMIEDSYACRQGKGQHSASRRTMQWVRKYKYCFQADVKKFYPSINHDILMNIVRRKIKDPDVLWLLEDIIYSIPGDNNVPIGNYTSQWLGNLYLNELDMYVKHQLREKAYLRYNDDFVIFGNDKQKLHEQRNNIRCFLKYNMDLTMSKDKGLPVFQGLDFVGYRHFPNKILLRKRTAKRVKKKIDSIPYLLKTGAISPESALSSIASTQGWLQWANTHNLSIALQLEKLKGEVNELCT